MAKGEHFLENSSLEHTFPMFLKQEPLGGQFSDFFPPISNFL